MKIYKYVLFVSFCIIWLIDLNAMNRNDYTLVHQSFSFEPSLLHNKKMNNYSDVSQKHRSWASRYSVDALSNKLKNKSNRTVQFLADKNDDNSIAGAIAIMASVSLGERTKIVDFLLPNNDVAQKNFLTMSITRALSHYSAAEVLSKHPMTKQPVTIFFLKNSDDKQLLKCMYDYFHNTKETTIQITKDQANQIVFWEDEIKNEFKNEKEFFLAEIMPNDSDKAVSLAVALFQGGLYGSAVTIAANSCYNYGKFIEKSRKDIFKNVSSAVIEGCKDGAQVSFFIQAPQTAALRDACNAWNEAHFICKPGAAIIAGINGFFTRLGKDALEEGMSQGYDHGSQLMKKTLIDGMSNIVSFSLLRYAGLSAGIGATINGIYALQTINDPIDTISISKI